MKYKYSIFIMAFVLLLAGACQKADSEFLHTDNTITSISISPVTSPITTSIQGDINQETGEIDFAIPKRVADYYDLTSLRVKANVGYDVEITPSLSGAKDLSGYYEITVTATMTGESKKYTLHARYSREM